MKKLKGRKKNFRTVGVRFLGRAQIYTYKVAAKAKIIPGDLLLVDSPCSGPCLVFAVQLDPPVPNGYTLDTLSLVSGKVVLL